MSSSSSAKKPYGMGQLFVRDGGGGAHSSQNGPQGILPGRKLMMVVSIVNVSRGFPVKSEHQAAVLTQQEQVEGEFLVRISVCGSGDLAPRDIAIRRRGLSADGILKATLWREGACAS